MKRATPRRRPHSNQRSDVFLLMLRDGARCYWCREGLRLHDPFEADHVIPFSAGGSDALTNKRLAHRSCNRRKGVG